LSPEYSLVLSHPSRIGALPIFISLFRYLRQKNTSSRMIYRFCFRIFQRCR
ncbi:unnamed protein product, partial [Brassica rapa subsp. trilocularis]